MIFSLLNIRARTTTPRMVHTPLTARVAATPAVKVVKEKTPTMH